MSICSGFVVLRLGNRGMEIAHPRICSFCFLSLQADGKLQLDILVENMGRVNFLSDINRQRKGGKFTVYVRNVLLDRGLDSCGYELSIPSRRLCHVMKNTVVT